MVEIEYAMKFSNFKFLSALYLYLSAKIAPNKEGRENITITGK